MILLPRVALKTHIKYDFCVTFLSHWHWYTSLETVGSGWFALFVFKDTFQTTVVNKKPTKKNKKRCKSHCSTGMVDQLCLIRAFMTPSTESLSYWPSRAPLSVWRQNNKIKFMFIQPTVANWLLLCLSFAKNVLAHIHNWNSSYNNTQCTHWPINTQYSHCKQLEKYMLASGKEVYVGHRI